MKKYSCLFLMFYLPMLGFSQGKENCRSRDLVILGARLADQSYTFSKLSYCVNSQKLASENIDSAVFYIQQAIMAIDSAIILASDSELLALDYSNIAKKYAGRSYKLLNACKQSNNIGIRSDYAKQATFYSANAVTDAYHASFYFKNCKPEVKEEKKDTTPPAPKQLTKLDVDQALFTLLNEHLTEKTEDHKKELARLSQEIKASKDPVKTEKLKEEIKRIEKEDAALAQKNKDAKEKLNTINTQIDDRDKNKNAAVIPEETVFSKSLKKPADEWNKQVLVDTELPMGLVYQVQIGLYKNAIQPEIFKGLTPVFAKTVPGGVSYSTGMFEKAADANQAKTYVKSIGLVDAFVISFYNRKKITLVEAAKLEKK
jgi:hypothetical protein